MRIWSSCTVLVQSIIIPMSDKSTIYIAVTLPTEFQYPLSHMFDIYMTNQHTPDYATQIQHIIKSAYRNYYDMKKYKNGRKKLNGNKSYGTLSL